MRLCDVSLTPNFTPHNRHGRGSSSPSPRCRSYWLGPPPPSSSALLHHRPVTLGGHCHHSGITEPYAGYQLAEVSLACTPCITRLPGNVGAQRVDTGTL